MTTKLAHKLISIFTDGAVFIGALMTMIAAIWGVPILVSVIVGTIMLLAWCAVGMVWLLWG